MWKPHPPGAGGDAVAAGYTLVYALAPLSAIVSCVQTQNGHRPPAGLRPNDIRPAEPAEALWWNASFYFAPWSLVSSKQPAYDVPRLQLSEWTD